MPTRAWASCWVESVWHDGQHGARSRAICFPLKVDTMTEHIDDETGIRTAIDYYVEGIRNGDVEILKRGFHPQAVMCGYLGDSVLATPIQGLYDWVNATPAPSKTGQLFSCTIKSIEITGRVAAAKMSEQWPDGAFTDYFTLLKVEGTWWLVSKTFDAD